MIYTFEARPSNEELDLDNSEFIPNSVVVTTPDLVSIPDILGRFEDFMRGCGFAFKEFASLREGDRVVERSEWYSEDGEDSEYTPEPEFCYLVSFSEMTMGTRFKAYSEDQGVWEKTADNEFIDRADVDSIKFTLSAPDDYQVYITRDDAQALNKGAKDY